MFCVRFFLFLTHKFPLSLSDCPAPHHRVPCELVLVCLCLCLCEYRWLKVLLTMTAHIHDRYTTCRQDIHVRYPALHIYSCSYSGGTTNNNTIPAARSTMYKQNNNNNKSKVCNTNTHTHTHTYTSVCGRGHRTHGGYPWFVCAPVCVCVCLSSPAFPANIYFRNELDLWSKRNGQEERDRNMAPFLGMGLAADKL